MRLQSKINIRFLLVMFLIFSVASLIFYYLMGRVIDQNIREMLESRKVYITLDLQKKLPTADPIISLDHSIFIKKIAKAEEYQNYTDTLAYDQAEKELIPFRKLTFTVETGNQSYQVILLQSLLEMEDLRMVIFSFMAALFLLVMISLFFVNRWLSSKTWIPFFKSLSVLNSWKFTEEKTTDFESTGIAEFDQLNKLLDHMMHKIRSDFLNLKEFTENASHEIQTPLAIIRSKLEVVLQDPSLNDLQYQQIKAAFESTIRLSKLNEALLLLSKIENQQFGEKKETDFGNLIQSRIENLKELFDLKQIEVVFQIDGTVKFNMNPLLSDILVNNLLSNAFRHNYEKGKIIVVVKSREISISNTGKNQAIDRGKLFRRFATHSVSGESNGLGLSIASEICKSNQILLSYRYSDEMHHFILKGEF